MKIEKQLAKRRIRRRYRVRNQVRASRTGRPRLSVFRSNKHIYAQLIDDEAGKTLVSASTAEPAICSPDESSGNRAAASKVGTVIAQRATEQGIKQVAFDRGIYRYHGRVAALADAAREAGLEF